jgi:hypothetical protein
LLLSWVLTFGVKSANSAQEDTAKRLDAARTQSIGALKEGIGALQQAHSEGLGALQKAHDDTQAAAKRNEIMISTIAGALSSDQAKDVLQVADRRLKEANP